MIYDINIYIYIIIHTDIYSTWVRNVPSPNCEFSAYISGFPPAVRCPGAPEDVKLPDLAPHVSGVPQLSESETHQRSGRTEATEAWLRLLKQNSLENNGYEMI
jgi:hypothetical protein